MSFKNLGLHELNLFLQAVEGEYGTRHKEAVEAAEKDEPFAETSMGNIEYEAIGDVMTMLQEERDERIKDIALDAIEMQLTEIDFIPEEDVLQFYIDASESVVEDAGNVISNNPSAFDDCQEEASKSAKRFMDQHPLNPLNAVPSKADVKPKFTMER